MLTDLYLFQKEVLKCTSYADRFLLAHAFELYVGDWVCQNLDYDFQSVTEST